MFVIVPFFSAIFLSGIKQAGRASLAGYAVLGPALMGLWFASLDLGGSIIDSERTQQTFELLVIAPCSFSRVLFGRVSVITGVGMLAVLESILFARLAFGVDVHIAQPEVMALTLAATSIAMASTCTAMAAIFVAARAARRFSNVLSYPFYILAGLLVPTTFLPLWIRPLGWLTYLYWSAELLRDSLSAQPIAGVAWRLLMIFGLGVVTYAAGLALTRRVINVLRRHGTIGLS